MAELMQLYKDGKILRVHPIRLYRAKKLGAFANPQSRVGRKNSAIGYVARVPEP